jgi:hypothetical protein
VIKTDKSDIIAHGDFFFCTYNEINHLIYYAGYDTEIVLPKDYNGEKYNIHTIAFENSSNMTSIKFSAGVNEVGACVFKNCYSIEKVIVDSIDEWFDITFVDAYSNPLSVSAYLYEKDTPITHVVIPEHVTEVKQYLFYRCLTIESLLIGPHVVKINSNSFNEYGRLENIYCFSTDYNDFFETYGLKPKDISFWADLWFYSEEEPQKSGWFWHYDENGNICHW